jgi:hypothetical protein
MAADAAASFADILAAESDYVMPSSDGDVKAALESFGVVFNKRPGDAHVKTRADLLAGLALLHTHHLNLAPMVQVLTAAQQQTLATALGLDFQAHGADASWPALLGRRIVSRLAPGSTPTKRKLAPAGVDGQIRKPGDGAPIGGPAAAAAGQPAPKKPRTAKRARPAPGSDSSAVASSGSEADSPSPGPAVVELMPDELGSGPAFDSLVAAVCARAWLRTSVLEDAIPAMYLPRLFRGRLWADKSRTAYDKMIKKQPATRPALSRREDPTNVAFPHRLKFAFSPDDGPELDAVHLRLVCAGERISDWSGQRGAHPRRHRRAVFVQATAERVVHRLGRRYRCYRAR